MGESESREAGTDLKPHSRLKGGIMVLVGCVLVHLTLGTVYTFGNMTPYLTSYLRVRNVSDVTYGESVWIFALGGMGQGASMSFGGLLEQKFGPRISILAGCWFASSGILLTFITIQKSFAATIITYGFMFGLGVGIAYAIPMACAMRWLPEKKGLVNGIVVAGFGGGAFIFDYVQTAFINPENLKTDVVVNGENYFSQDSIIDEVPKCFLLLGGVYAAMQLVGVLLIRNPPGFTYTAPDDLDQSINEKVGLLDDEADINEDDMPGRNAEYEVDLQEARITITLPLQPDNPGRDTSGLELSTLEVLKTRAFYTLWFVFLLNGMIVLFVSTLYKAYGQTFIQDDFFLAVVGGLASVCNAGGRIMWGTLSDKFSYRIAMMGLTASMAVLMLTLQITSLAGKAMYFIWVCAIFLTFSGNFSLFPTATARSFGQKNMVKNYGLVFTSQVVVGPIGAVLTSKLKDALDWSGMFFFIAGLSVLGLVVTFTFNVKRWSDGRHI